MANSRANSGLDLHLDLDPTAGRGVRLALEHALREAVAGGRLLPGSVLPPSRSLALDLGVARNSVAEAYAQLVAEGWLIARQGSATRVADRPRAAPAQDTSEIASARLPRYDLRAGFPDVTSFPHTEWLASARAALAQAPALSFGYGPDAGLVELRTALADYLARARGVRAHADDVVICSGFTAGLALLAAVLRARGVRSIGVEAYGHRHHRALLADAGLKVVPLPVDDEGATLTGVGQIGAVLLTPAHQFPLGMALSPRRRAQFVEWATRTDSIVIEDDYDGEFRYDRRALGAVQALASANVAYAGTASKTLAPGVRIGWLVAPRPLRKALLDRQALVRLQPPTLDQLTLAHFLTSGRYDRHVRRARLTYRRRRDRLIDALVKRGISEPVSGLNAGLHSVLRLPPGLEEVEVVSRALSLGLAVDGLDGFRTEGVPRAAPALVVGYGTPPPNAYTTAIARLLTVLSGR